MKGHYWTIAPRVVAKLKPAPVGRGKPFRLHVPEGGAGPVNLVGTLHEAGPDLVLIVHGLGGDMESLYMQKAARACLDRGLSALCLNMRGADGEGDDIYHAGFTDDIATVLACEQLSRFRHRFVLGFSLGGHLVLQWTRAPSDDRVRAVASVCAPLDLAAACQHMDGALQLPYRSHVLEGLKAGHRAWAVRGRACRADRHVQGVRSIREWDEHVVVPRFGFGTADRYYATMQVGPRLAELQLPSLLVCARQDPMIPARTLLQPLQNVQAPSEVRWVNGGHLGFPPGTDPVGDALDWLTER